MTVVLGLSIALQLTAALYAIYLMRFTGPHFSWICVSAALVLMSVRRLRPLISLLEGRATVDIVNEEIGLALSVFMLAGILGISRIFLAKRESEKRVRELLAEKELLLRESHHRVRNNMTAILGFITMCIDAPAGPSRDEALASLGRRVETMLGLYDSLFASQRADRLSVDRYLADLARKAVEASPSGEGVRLETRLEAIEFGADRLLAIGLILNEVLANALKHGLAKGGRLILASRAEGELLEFTVEDDGPGLPPATERGKGFGMTLIEALVRQLSASVEWSGPPGTRFRLLVPRCDPRSRAA